MPFVVNGELVPLEWICREEERLCEMEDDVQRKIRLREAAETTTINRVLIHQEAMKDARPIDEAAIESHCVLIRQAVGSA